ncbi:MAG: L,D-transpeptidase family protein [Bacteroidota bacterium]
MRINISFLQVFLLLIILISSCQEEKKEVFYLDKKIKASEKIKWLLKDENNHLLNLDEKAVLSLRKLYKKRKHKSLWVNDSIFTNKGKFLLNELKNPLAFGIPNSRLNINSLKHKNLIIKEILITNSILTLSHDLKYGCFDSLTKKLKPVIYPNHFPQITRLEKIKKDFKRIPLEIISFGPQDTSYQKLSHALYRFVKTKKMNDANLKVPNFKKDSINSLNFAKKSLVQKSFLKNENCDSLTFDSALKAFQKENGLKEDAVIGDFTTEALNETNLEKCQRLALVLEKLRWQNINEKRFIVVNIPEYTLRYFSDDTLKSVNRIIVGKFDTKTPEFNAELRTIVAYPFWNVPFSITSKEILPDAKKNPNYFARNHMKIYKKNEEIDPLTVDWKAIRNKTFPYKVIQQTGSFNSLGIIKFEFNNPYGVYIHDTPNKNLFNTVIRSYSHGCMRCENPIDLAKIILLKDENKTIPDSLDSIMARRNHHKIQLKKRIQIYVVYQSVVMDSQNNLIFLRDIYRKDKRLAKYMFA